MRSIKMDFVRGGGDTAVLTTGTLYHVVIESSRHRQFLMPLDQEKFFDALAALRYHTAFTEAEQQEALNTLATNVTAILDPPVSETETEGLQLDLVTNARELWALPFEVARATDGQPLFARRAPAIVLTRRAAQPFAERQSRWPSRPRVLFAWASPDWTSAPLVPAPRHKQALLKALQPWVEPIAGLPVLAGSEESVMTTIPNATLASIAQACREAVVEGRPYSHVHLLAHGVVIETPGQPHRTRYGIALNADDGKPTAPEAIVNVLRPPRVAEVPNQDLPVVVTLAICDAGNAANPIIQSGSLAQELHRAGVPIVLASQLPLTFDGSEILTREFYRGWLGGKDVRNVLHETRVALYESKNVGHDWVSLVAYVHLQEGYADYLFSVRLASELAALETASKYASMLLERNIVDPAQVGQVSDRLRQCAMRLEASLAELDASALRTRNDIVQENAGLLGSALKRSAELLAWRATVAPLDRDGWLDESRASMAKARDAYKAGFLRNTSHHWTGVQYLALDAVLTGHISKIADWYTTYVAATAQRDDPTSSVDTRVWALGSIAELQLLAILDSRLSTEAGEAEQTVKQLVAMVKASIDHFPDAFPIYSTYRQLKRYVDWWTKTNDFFAASETDLSVRARHLGLYLSKAQAKRRRSKRG
jgi:hypothetical protein